jgi:hypothetical protein
VRTLPRIVLVLRLLARQTTALQLPEDDENGRSKEADISLALMLVGVGIENTTLTRPHRTAAGTLVPHAHALAAQLTLLTL